MGFGLYIGWAIEGALGTPLKVDASYLSPNPNISEKLEEHTKEYGAPILLSQVMVDQFSPEVRALVRKIDRLTVCNTEMNMWAYDLPRDLIERVKAWRATGEDNDDPAFFEHIAARTTLEFRAACGAAVE